MVSSAENNRNISIPGTARRVFAVGRYRTRLNPITDPTGGASNFSCRAPTRLDVQKPEISAPGESIISARSSNSFMPASSDAYCNMMRFESMVGPHGAGAFGVQLSEHPNLTADQAKQFLQRSARVDGNSSSAPETTWNAGKLDDDAAIPLANNVTFPEVSDVTTNNGGVAITTNIPTTVTVSFHRSRRQLLLGKSEGTRASLTLGTQHQLDISSREAGTYFVEVLAFSSYVWWTLDDNGYLLEI